MKISFFHDHRLRQKDNIYYSLGGLSSDVLERYTDIFGEIDVVCRKQDFLENEKLEEYSLTSNEKSNIVGLSSISIFDLLLETSEKKRIKEVVRNSDGIIVRLPSIIGLIACKEAYKLNIPVFVEMVADVWSSYWYHSTLGKIFAIPLESLNKKMIKKADFVLYVTGSYLQSKYPTNGEKIGCSDVVLPDKNVNFVERYNEKKEPKITIGTLAAVNVKYKGQKSMIDAIPILKEKGIDVEYQIVGSGNDSFLRKIAKKNNVEENVKFMGSINHSEVFSWLQTLDIYIQPSKQEGLPRAVVEAMSTGLFCMGANTGGIPELISPDYIFSNNRNNHMEIAEIIENLNINKMKIAGKNNFDKSINFRNSKLKDKRNNFYLEYKNYLIERNR